MAKKKKTAEEQSVNIDGTEYKVCAAWEDSICIEWITYNPTILHRGKDYSHDKVFIQGYVKSINSLRYENKSLS